jgi:magnesium transporter
MSKRRKKIGLPPGSVVFTGNRKVEKTQIHYLKYDSENVVEKKLTKAVDPAIRQKHEEKVNWYDIRGIHDTNLIEFIGRTFEIHPLVLEDVASTNQRPKFEEYEKGIFIALQALSFDKEEIKISKEQVTLYFNSNLLITFQERETDLFESVRQRIQKGNGKIRQRKTDYLSYALIDSIVDNYFFVLEDIEEVIESLENDLLEKQDKNIKIQIHQLKKELLIMRKAIFPLREAIGWFAKAENPIIEDNSQIFVRDLYDHIIQIMDLVESYRDMLNGLQDLFISEVSFKMNQVMQLLTLIATIFIPLTFFAGIYGMNFDNMPELHWEYGYFYLLGTMLIVFVSLLYYFKRKNWI